MVLIMCLVTLSPSPLYRIAIYTVLVLLLIDWRLFTSILKNCIPSRSRSTRLNGYQLIDLYKVSGLELLPDNPKKGTGCQKKNKTIYIIIFYVSKLNIVSFIGFLIIKKFFFL